MKSDFIAVSLAGAFGILFAGFLLGEAYKDHDPIYVLMAVLVLLVVRSDARIPFETGSYKRGWFIWTKIDSASEISPKGQP
jgi:hypothetical protein